MAYTKDEFKQLVDDIQAQSWYKNPIGFGIARVDRGQINKDKILQATFPVINWNENFGRCGRSGDGEVIIQTILSFRSLNSDFNSLSSSNLSKL